MLRRLAPTLFEGATGDTVRIAAVAQRNNGLEAATFRYGATTLPARLVQGHPGCVFNVQTETTTFDALVVFFSGAPNASYELFEEDDKGLLHPLQLVATPLSGPILQFQIVAVAAEAAKRGVKKAAKTAAKKATKRVAKKAKKQKAAKKAAKKKATKRVAKVAKTAVKKTAAKKTAKKAVKRTARKTAKRRRSR